MTAQQSCQEVFKTKGLGSGRFPVGTHSKVSSGLAIEELFLPFSICLSHYFIKMDLY